MKYRTLGSTGLTVSEIGLGAWAIGGPARLGQREIGWGRTDDATSLAALRACLDLGINFIDTADAYGAGHSEELIGQAFAAQRDQVVIETKGGNRTLSGEWIKDFSSAWITQAIEDSLRRLRTDYIDIYLLHTPRPDIGDFGYRPEDYEPLEQAKAAGKIRHYGISIGPPSDGLRMIESGRGEVMQVVYNMLEREPEAALFAAAREHRIGVVARVPLASGFLTGKFSAHVTFPPDDHRSTLSRAQIAERVAAVERLRFLERGGRTLAQAALRFVLADEAVSVIIPGAKTPRQLAENARASDLPPLTPDELRRVREAVPWPSA
jgi:aryl-alcohol dehydrogenase-like predicted oxidoreductase